MRIISYNKPELEVITKECAKALHNGKVVIYPTDTSYGLAVDTTNTDAIKRLYAIKGRAFNKPVHVVVASMTMAKRWVRWNISTEKLARAFWPGALTIVSKLKVQDEHLQVLTAGTGFLGVRMPDNAIALELAKKLGRPVTATSANISGMPDCYSIEEVVAQFRRRKFKPDILIDTGQLSIQKPSTVVRVDGKKVDVLRVGPVSELQVKEALGLVQLTSYLPQPLLS